MTWTIGVALAVAAGACGGSNPAETKQAPAPAAAAPAAAAPAQKVGDGPFQPPPITVNSSLPEVKIDGATGSIPVSSAASYGWSAFIALNWPASTAANTRGVPDTTKTFGQSGTPVWETLRSKVEVYPGNGSAKMPPHGVTLDGSGKPTNAPDYGYGDAQQYYYSTGLLQPCQGQAPVTTPALVVLDETTEINVNQTFAGAAPATDPQGYNSKPQLIRYAVKMNQPLYSRAVAGQYWWYSAAGSPLATAKANFVTALNSGQGQDPAEPYVNFAPVPPNLDPNQAGIEIKTAWRVLTPAETSSGRFITSTVRYYEQPSGSTSCYREATWGLVGMHVISFSLSAPWVMWTTFEQVDNILTADGKRTEDENGNPVIGPLQPATSPALSSDPSVLNPVIKMTGDYCATPGSQLYFRENPKYASTMPTKGNICVNHRWTAPEKIFVDANVEAHTKISAYLASHGGGTSPLMYYKLVGAQGVPVDVEDRNGGTFSTTTSYLSANAVIETDYSLGKFTGNLTNGVPSDVVQQGSQVVPYYNTHLLPFQAARLGLGKMRMGGCAGCHDIGGLNGKDFSFALGNNVLQPEATNAFATPNLMRTYFPLK
jgi:hypothetical protein